MREIGCVVSLTATQEVIFARVSRNKRRPLLQNADPRGTIAKMLERRAPLYQACAQFEIDTTTRDHAGVADAILSEAINRYPQA